MLFRLIRPWESRLRWKCLVWGLGICIRNPNRISGKWDNLRGKIGQNWCSSAFPVKDNWASSHADRKLQNKDLLFLLKDNPDNQKSFYRKVHPSLSSTLFGEFKSINVELSLFIEVFPCSADFQKLISLTNSIWSRESYPVRWKILKRNNRLFSKTVFLTLWWWDCMMRKKLRGTHEKQIRSTRVLSRTRDLLETESQFEWNRHLLRTSWLEVTFTLLHSDRFPLDNSKR
jgi:hypothetical protein